MKMLKRILAAVAASAVSLCIFTACGSSSDPKYDTSIFIKTARAKTGYELKESKSLDDALQAGLNALSSSTDYTNEVTPGYQQTAYDAIKKALGDPDAAKYQYITSATVGNNLRALAAGNGGESPVAAYTFDCVPIKDFGSNEYKDLNSAQLYTAATNFLNNQFKLFVSTYNQHQPAANGISASYVPEEISVSIKTITVNGKSAPYVFVLLKGTMSVDS